MLAQQVENVGSQEDLAKQRKMKELQDEIRNLFSEGRFETAIDKAEELLILNPGDATATLLRERAQRYLASGMAPPTPVAPAQILPTPTPIPTAEPAAVAGAEAPVSGTDQPSEAHTPAASSTSSEGGMMGMILKVVGALVGVALIAFLVLWLKSRKLSLPKVAPVRSLAAGNLAASASPLGMMGGLSSAAPVTQPGYFMDVEPDPATLQTQQATVYDENTNVEAMGAKDKSQRIPMMNEQDRLAMADLPTAPGNIGSSGGDVVVDGIDGIEDEGETIALPKAPAPAAPDISGLRLDAPRAKSEPPAPKPVAPDPVTIPEMAPRPAPPAPKPPPKPPMDIAAMLPPLEDENPPTPAAASAGLDLAPPSLFAPADQTASVDPAALSFNSLMFGTESTQDKAPAAAAASSEDLTLNSFNQEFSSVMFGTGTEETNMPSVTGAPAAPAAANAPAAEESQAKTVVVAPITQKAVEHDGGETISLAPASDARDLAEAETIAPVAAAPSTKVTMFERQRDAGKAAYDAGDFAKAVHCLSIAASLKPSDKDIRALLDDARQKRRG